MEPGKLRCCHPRVLKPMAPVAQPRKVRQVISRPSLRTGVINRDMPARARVF